MMDEVYIVRWIRWEDQFIEGAYSTVERAQTRLRALASEKPKEIYEICTLNVDQDGWARRIEVFDPTDVDEVTDDS